MKKILKRIGMTIGLLLIVFLAYLAYVLIAYHRLPDKLTLEVSRNGSDADFEAEKQVERGKDYRIMTYNIGYGAYSSDYSFFMDGGKYAWAKDQESVIAGIRGMGAYINSVNPDFALIQEVDVGATRSYHVDEQEMMNQSMAGYYNTYAQNYDSTFLFFPPWQPIGATKSGIMTYSRYEITNAIRRSFPVSESFSKLFDLDRCYSIARIPMEDGKSLCIYNVHLSAYGSNDEVREGQVSMLFGDMEADYQKGNYVICGGDFNHNLKSDGDENAPGWAFPLPRESLPEGFHMAMDSANADDLAHNSCRNADQPYDEATSYTVTVDGFIVSDNVKIKDYRNIDLGYELSDHDPVIMQFELK